MMGQVECKTAAAATTTGLTTSTSLATATKTAIRTTSETKITKCNCSITIATTITTIACLIYSLIISHSLLISVERFIIKIFSKTLTGIMESNEAVTNHLLKFLFYF